MPAQLKVYADSGHTTEVAHTANVSTTLSAIVNIGATTLTVVSTTGMPAQGFIDVDTGASLETLPYTSISGTTITLAEATTISHNSGVAAVQWYYSLLVGNQSTGIPNDGTNAAPDANNTVTYYLYNAGDQTAQAPVMVTSSAAPSTPSGYSDTLISVTSATTGFATSLTLANILAGAAPTEFWVVAEIPSGQSGIGNPQVCVINISTSSI